MILDRLVAAKFEEKTENHHESTSTLIVGSLQVNSYVPSPTCLESDLRVNMASSL